MRDLGHFFSITGDICCQSFIYFGELENTTVENIPHLIQFKLVPSLTQRNIPLVPGFYHTPLKRCNFGVTMKQAADTGKHLLEGEAAGRGMQGGPGVQRCPRAWVAFPSAPG